MAIDGVVVLLLDGDESVVGSEVREVVPGERHLVVVHLLVVHDVVEVD